MINIFFRKSGRIYEAFRQPVSLHVRYFINRQSSKKLAKRLYSKSSEETDVNENSENGDIKPFNSMAIVDLFREKFDDELLFFPEVLTAEQWTKLIDYGEVVEEALGWLKYEDILSKCEIKKTTIETLADLNLFKMAIPKKYGGLGFSAIERKYIHEILGLYPSLARLVSENEETGIIPLVKYGTEEQKQNLLPKLANGELMISLAFLEDSSSTLDSSRYMGLEAVDDGSKFILNGTKSWVYNAKHADLFLVFGTQKMEDKEDQMKINSLFLVDRKSEGVRINKPMKKLWLRGLDLCQVVFDEVFVDHSNIVGGYGRGFDVLKEILSKNKTSLGAESTAAIKRLVHDAFDKSKSKTFMNKPLSSYSFSEFTLGELACLAYAVESLTYYLAARADYYHEPNLTLEVYMAKVFAAEALPLALQLYFNLVGKHGYEAGSFVEELVQNAYYYSVIDENSYDMKIFLSTCILQDIAKDYITVVKKLEDPLNHPSSLMKYKLRNVQELQESTIPRIDLRNCVSSALKIGVEDLAVCISRLRISTEMHIMNSKRSMLKNDYELLILADMLINTYALIACLARAHRATSLALPDSCYETFMANQFGMKTVRKVTQLSNLLTSNIDELENYTEIGRKAINNKNYLAEHPLMRNF